MQMLENKNLLGYHKNANFDAEFESIEENAKNSPNRSNRPKTFALRDINKKTQFIAHILADNFLHESFCNFSADS